MGEPCCDAAFVGTVRNDLASEAERRRKNGEACRVYWKSHWSTVFLTGEVVNPLHFGQGGNVQAFVVFPAKEWEIAFSYGLSDCCEGDESDTPEWKPSRLETDLNVAFSLDPERKMAVEVIVARPLNPRVAYAPEDIIALGVEDKYALAALTGGLDPLEKRPIEYTDPLALTLPPELTIGPKVFFHNVADVLRNTGYVEHCIGSANRRGRDLGPLSRFGTGDKDSFVRNFGRSEYGVEEGILWDDQTKKEGRFGLIFTTERAAVMSITLVPGVIGGSETILPKQVTLPLRFECWGLEVAYGDAANEG